MADVSRIAGIVLAGGKSSRMGRDKAMLEYKGQPLLQHMLSLLRITGLSDIFVSGNIPGYPCIEDLSPASGPVEGIMSVINQKPGYAGYLFIPVDMPLLTARSLKILLSQKEGGYFIDWPLPLYLTPPVIPSHKTSVHGFLEDQGIYPVELPAFMEDCMKNVNTPMEWQEVTGIA
jgi:molybdopterin-guanine dinucleotide biosynthesis protein A